MAEPNNILDFEDNKDQNGVYTFNFRQSDANLMANRLAELLAEEKYALESGSKMDGTYGTGSHILRILFGAFVKRYVVKITVKSSLAGTEVTLQKGMSGWSGGLIGINKLKKELKRLADKIQQLDVN